MCEICPNCNEINYLCQDIMNPLLCSAVEYELCEECRKT